MALGIWVVATVIAPLYTLDEVVGVLPSVVDLGALVQSERYLEATAIMTQMVEVTAVSELFKGRQFDEEIIVDCLQLYLSYRLSSRDLVEMLGICR